METEVRKSVDKLELKSEENLRHVEGVAYRIRMMMLHARNVKLGMWNVPNKYKQLEGEDNLIVITKHSNKFYFSDFYFYKDTLRGKASTHSMGKRMDKEIAISDIISIESEYFDRGKTTLLGLGVGVIVTFIFFIILTSQGGWVGT